MCNGIDRMDTFLNDNVSKCNNSKPGKGLECLRSSNRGRQWRDAKSVIRGAGLIWIIAIGAALLVSAGPAFGQFTVQPMQLNLSVTPGKLVKSELRVVSFDPNNVHDITLSVTELTMSTSGDWEIIEPNNLKDPNSPYFGFDTSKLSSCRDWISLSPNRFDLAPLGYQPIEVSLRVQHNVRGFFGAGIVVSSSAMKGRGNVDIVLRFVVPVIVEIQDRPVRPNVKATDIGMEFIPSNGELRARSVATMDVENDGGTYSELKPFVRIWSFSDGHWRVITTTDFDEKSIIPGVKIQLKQSIRKPLPSGKYKIAGILYVDGRRTKKIEKEIDYTGDQRISGVGADAPLDLEPLDLTIEGLPGASRTSTIKVINASKETVNIRTALGLQSNLQYKAMGDVKGEDLNCTSWIKVTPEQFTLRGEGGVQTLRVDCTMPETATQHPCYYTLLALWASYPDGKDAGVTTTNICVRDEQIKDVAPAAVVLKLITPQDLGESKYLIGAKFGNYGMIHFTPIKVKAGLTMPNGINRVQTFLYGNPNIMLPFEDREFSGVLDLSEVPADLYRFAAAIEYAPGVWADKQMAVRVSIEGERRIINIVGVEEELGNLVQVKWQ
jgi:hypothetical protein